MTTNVETVAETLVRGGVDTLFGLIGNGNLDLVGDMTGRRGVRYVGVRHENAAVAAADGFARAGNRTGVATVTHGPGLTNAITALVTARRARSPLLLITGNASFNTGRSTQRLDHRRAIEALGVPVVQPAQDEDWSAAAEEALALTREGAVLLDLPAAAMRRPAQLGRSRPARPAEEPAPPPDPGKIRSAASMIAQSKRAIVLAGRGALRAGVREDLIVLASRCGALLATSLPAKGLFHGADGDIGVAGGLASPHGRAACSECDLVIAVGASLNGFTTEDAKLFSGAKVIRLDRDPAATSSIPVDLAISGDLSPAIAALLDELPAAIRQVWLPPDSRAAADATTWPERVLDDVERLLSKDRTLVFDHGDLPNAALMRFNVSDPTQWIFMPDFGSLGLSVAAALGAAAARPDRRAVAVVGDGGLMMSLSELDTLKRAGLPVLVLVLNNGCYGAEYPHLREIGAPLAPATFDSASFADIARAIGIKAISIGDGDNLGTLAEMVTNDREPALIEVRCAPP
jgi:thiamine pyrophosphate-dependent acetolactate synthase large subunit-like protein